MSAAPIPTTALAEAQEAVDAALEAAILAAAKMAVLSPASNARKDLEQVTMKFPPETLMGVDRMARDHGMTRGALLSLFVRRGLDRGLS